MDSDPLTGAGRPKHIENRKSAFSGLNLVMCVLCVVSVLSSGYNSWNQYDFKSKINVLEERVSYLEEKFFANVNVLVERLKREAVNNLRNRVARDLASRSDAELPRDAPECVCPAGKNLFCMRYKGVKYVHKS